GVEEEPGFAVGGVKPAAVILCGEQPALGRLVFGVTGPVWPLDAAGLVDVAVVADAGEIAGPSGGQFLQDLKGFLRSLHRAEEVIATPGGGDEAEDGEVGERLSRRARDALEQAQAPLGVDEGAFLFAPAGGGKKHIGP